MLADKTFQYSYSQINKHQPAEFCHQALSNSLRLELGLGYFSTASFNVLANGLARFIVNGGTMNLYINQYVTKEDYELLKGKHDTSFDADLTSRFRTLKNTFEKRDEHFFRCLSYLIAAKRINVKIVVLSNGGLPHEKYGIFTDEVGNKIYFNGSMNMTANALLGNLETIECTCSWKGDDSRDKVQEFEEHFHNVWSGNCQGVIVYEAKAFCNEVLVNYPNQDPEQLVKTEEEFVRKMQRERKKSANAPRFPSKYPNGALPYQEEAYNAWIGNGKKGIFAMATGTGKTVTSLNCVVHEYEVDEFYHLLVLVPTLDLVEQWVGELREFNIKKPIEVSSLNPTWRNELLDISRKMKRGRAIDFAIISTYDSFAGKDFQYLLPSLSDGMILIADEAHNIGGKLVKQCFEKLTVARRIALSATPERIYDSEESEGIGVFFDDKRPYVYSFPMSEAIAGGRLCKYFYYPKVAYLNEAEMDLYAYYTKRLVALWDEHKKCFKNKKEAETILMNRKRIIHKCKDKVRVYREILHDIGEDKLKYAIVYAPQGKYSEVGDEEALTEADDIAFIKLLLDETKTIYPNKLCNKFTSEENKKDRSAFLKALADGTLDVLLAMKCLDEGVNVPRAEIGIFTASTGNPREFIQRRGRLLRVSKGKDYSYIYDIIVVPNTINSADSTSKMESNLVKTELRRVAYFATLAQNCYANNGAYEVLNEVAHHFGLIWSDLIENIEQ